MRTYQDNTMYVAALKHSATHKHWWKTTKRYWPRQPQFGRLK
jgi:hypothetical protein